MEFIKSNVIMDMMIKNVKFAELNSNVVRWIRWGNNDWVCRIESENYVAI